MSGRIEMHALHVLRRVETRDFAGSVKPPNHSSSVCWLHVYRKLNLLFSSENSTHEQTKREHFFWYTDVPEVGRCLKMAPLRVYHMTK